MPSLWHSLYTVLCAWFLGIAFCPLHYSPCHYQSETGNDPSPDITLNKRNDSYLSVWNQSVDAVSRIYFHIVWYVETYSFLFNLCVSGMVLGAWFLTHMHLQECSHDNALKFQEITQLHTAFSTMNLQNSGAILGVETTRRWWNDKESLPRKYPKQTKFWKPTFISKHLIKK